MCAPRVAKNLIRNILLSTVAVLALRPDAGHGHTVSIGYTFSGPGAVTLWYGSYHPSANFNEADVQLVGPSFNSTVAFSLLTGTKPTGLVDGTNNFYSNTAGTQLVATQQFVVSTDGSGGSFNPATQAVVNWQGANFTGLRPGTYTFTYNPLNVPTVEWHPINEVIETNSFTGFQFFGTNQNQTAVGTALDTVINAGGYNQSFYNLAALPPAQLAAALTQLSGEPHAQTSLSGFRSMDAFLSAMLDPWSTGMSGLGMRGDGFGASGSGPGWGGGSPFHSGPFGPSPLGGGRYDSGMHDPQHYGGPQYGGSQYGDPQYGDPQYGGSQYGNPQYGNSQYGDPRYGNTQYGGSQYGDPQYGNQQYGTQQYGNQQYNNSRYGDQQYGNSQYGNSQYGSGRYGDGRNDGRADRQPCDARMAGPPTTRRAFDPCWSAWSTTYGNHSRSSGDAVIGSHDTTLRTNGIIGGVDVRLTPGTVVGAAIAGGTSTWGLSHALGGGNSDVSQTGAYGSARLGSFFLSAAFAYSWHDMNINRKVTLDGSDELRGSFVGQNIGGRIEAGLGLTPYAALQMQSFTAPGYSESAKTGNATFALDLAERTTRNTRTELGVWLDRHIAIDRSAQALLRGRVAWLHNWMDEPAILASFQTLPGASFTVLGAKPSPDALLSSIALDLKFAHGLTIGARFDGEFASSSQIYAGTGTLRYQW
jgi:uncharacterized protein with beta-barrel porin domain